MFAKEITFTDYNGVKRTETHLFNLNKAELAEMELSTAGGMHDMLKRIMDTEDMPQIVQIFKQLILKSYGVKSADGKRFIKKDPNTGRPLSADFEETEAYSELFIELASNPDAAAAFVNGVIPAEMSQAALQENANNIATIESARTAAIETMKSGN